MSIKYQDPSNTEEILDKIRLSQTLGEIKNILDNTFPGWFIGMLPKFSEDYPNLTDSWNKICELAKNYNFILGLNLNGNFGQHNAIMAGLNNCKGKYIITLDDDLQHPPEFFPDILEALKYSQICYTNYRNRKHIGWKKFVSKLNNLVSSFILNKPPKIYMSSFRGFTKEVNLKIIEFRYFLT